MQAIAVAALLAGPVDATIRQPRPDFSGAWGSQPQVPQKTPAPDQNGGVSHGKPRLTISQNAKQIVLSSGSVTETYALDGSETTSYMKVAGQLVPVKCRARWDGSRLVLTAAVPLPTGVRQLSRNVFIDPQGNLVLQESSDGNGGPTSHTLRYYRQATVM